MNDGDQSRKQHQDSVPVGIGQKYQWKHKSQKKTKVQHSGQYTWQEMIPADQAGQCGKDQHEKCHIICKSILRKIKQTCGNTHGNTGQQEKNIKNPHQACYKMCIRDRVYAVGSGLIEVLCSPIVEACPFDNKEATMSLLHSFYCWGAVGTIVISTLFFAVFGMDSWKWLAVLWALVPAINIYNFATCPIEYLVDERCV